MGWRWKMRGTIKAAMIAVLALGLLLASVRPSDAWRGHGHGHHRHGRVFIVGSVWWWDPWYPYWWYPPPYYVYPPPSAIRDEPVEYIEQPRAQPSPRPEAYWYYCPSAKAYYPTVSTCPDAWVKVPPRSE